MSAKLAKYDRLYEQIKGYVQTTDDIWARLATMYEGENETYIEASAENSGSTLYDKEIRDKPRTRHTKRNV